MNKEQIAIELEALTKEFGMYPYSVFNILQKSDNPNLDLETQNTEWEFVKSEKWHSLNMSSYVLWAVTDNGDLLWWNGDQTIAMNPRDSEFMSLPVGPRQFIRLVGMGKVTGIFPPDIWKENA